MSDETRQEVNTNSEEFKEGVEAGLNSGEDTKNWCAGNELGQELKAEDEKKEPVSECFSKEPESRFAKDGPEGNKGNESDERRTERIGHWIGDGEAIALEN